MQALWTGLDRADWDRLHRTVAGALQQDWAYGDALQSLGTTCLRVQVRDRDGPVCLAQFLVRRIAGLVPVALCSLGPVWTAGTTPQRQSLALRAIRTSVPLRRPRQLLFTPDLADGPPSGFSRWRRVLTGQSVVRIDLTAGGDALRAAMHGKWRNRLAAAERSGLQVRPVGARPAQYRWLLDRERAQRERRGYIALPDGFVEAWQAACEATGRRDAVVTLRADAGREAVAGMMFLVHGDAATYHVGWAGEAGRAGDAHNLLLWHAMTGLAARGVRVLDLGGVDTVRRAGLARFKIGSGGAVVTLAGTYA
jgi:hypothetical protein